MPITPQQLAKRNTRIGSSDLAAILGFDPFKNAYDVWLEKTDKLVPEPHEAGGVKFFGQIFEDGLLDHFARDIDVKIARNQFRSATKTGLDFPMGSNVDAVIVNDDGTWGDPVEAKTSGLLGPLFETWGDAGTDEIPDRVIIQAHSHMICTERDLCHVAAFLGGRGYVRYAVQRQDWLVDKIIEDGHKFWHNHVLADIPPENLTPNLNLVKRLRKIPESMITFGTDGLAALGEWEAARQARLAAEKAEKTYLANVLAKLGDAEAADCGEIGTFTYFETSRAGYEVKPCTYRTPRLVKPKAEKKAKAA